MDKELSKQLSNRRYVIAGVATLIVVVYIIRLFTLQLMSDDYKKNADSNAFLKKVEFPSRGVITDKSIAERMQLMRAAKDSLKLNVNE